MRNFIQPSDPNEKLAHVINTITKVTRSTFEFRKLTRKESKSKKKKPWMTPALIKSCRKRKKLYHKKQRKNDPVVDEEYRIYKYKLNHLLKIAEQNYKSEKFRKTEENSGKAWKTINHF